MTVSHTTSQSRNVWMSALALGVLTLIWGVLVLVWPEKSIEAASIFFAAYLVGSGIAQIVFAVTLGFPEEPRALLFINGALSLVLGLFAFQMFEQDDMSWMLLSIWTGVAFIFGGMAAIAMAIESGNLPGQGWLVFMGAMSVIAGLVVQLWPVESMSAITYVVGIWLCILGITEIVWALRARQVINDTERGMGAAASAAR